MSGCGNSSGPSSTGPLIGVTRLEDGQIAVVDVTAGRVVGHWGLALPVQSYHALSLDSTTLYYAGFRPPSTTSITLVAADAKRGNVRWSRDTKPGVYTLPDGKTLVRFFMLPALLVPTADTGEILWYPAARDTVQGIARYRAGSDQVTGFLAVHIAAGHATVLRGRATLPRGTLVVCASRRQTARPTADALFLIGPDLAVLDSVQLPVPAFEAYDVVVTPDERFAFVKSPPHIFKVDLAARRIVAQLSTSNLGFLSLTASGEILIETDPGVALDLPSSGKVGLYTSELQPIGAVDLRPLSPGGIPPTTWDAVTSRDGATAFVIAGTPRGTLGQLPQLASLFVIDLVTRVATARIPLDQWGAGRVYFIR